MRAGLGSESETLIQDAVRLANTFGARLLGVSTPMTSLEGFNALEADTLQRLLEAAGEHFRKCASQVHAGSTWCRSLLEPAAALVSLSWAADLLLTDCRTSNADGLSFARLMRFMSQTQRPVLARTDPARRLAWDRVLILWDQSSPCRNAIQAAMPLLARSKDIVIVQVTPRHLIWADALCDLERGLSYRKLQVRVEGREKGLRKAAAEDLLEELDPDLLVVSARRRWPDTSPPSCLERSAAHVLMSV